MHICMQPCVLLPSKAIFATDHVNQQVHSPLFRLALMPEQIQLDINGAKFDLTFWF